MKRFIAIVLITLIVLTVAGCGNETEYKKRDNDLVHTYKISAYTSVSVLPDDFICPLCKHPASDFKPL